MNARFCLLAIVTGLFMAAWDGDQAAMEAAMVRREARIQQARILLAETPSGSDSEKTTRVETVTASVDVLLTHTTDQADSNVLVAEDVPLPPKIAAGDYRVVDQFGRTTVIEIHQNASTSEQSLPLHSFLDEDGNPWYFIRLAAR